jgi:hypothetical protein
VGALEVVGEVYVHVEIGHGMLLAVAAVLDPDRMADILDAYLVDGYLAGVSAALYVSDFTSRFGTLCHNLNPRCP